jgi:transcriptional regulator with XRE-family HTH domain
MTDHLPPIAKHLRSARDDAGLSQQQLAMAAGLSVSVVCQVEQGKTPDPRISTVVRLADALSVSVDSLLGRRRPRPGK